MNYDVIVIGGGYAGCVAALRAAEYGRSVALVSDNPGASHQGSGIFDIIRDFARPSDIAVAPASSFSQCLSMIAKTSNLHPYTILGGSSSENTFRKAILYFLDSISKGGIETTGAPGDMMLFMTNLGTLKYAACATRGIADGALSDPAAMRLAIIGFRGLAEFDSKFVAASVASLVRRAKDKPFQSIASFEIGVPGFDSHTNFTTYQIAETLDDSITTEDFLKSVKETIGGGGYTHIAFPAVIGLREHRHIMTALRDSLQAKVCEIATMQPSVPGIRITGALRSHLVRSGVRVISGKANGFNRDGRNITAISVNASGAEPIALSARNYVLATGKFIGGGIRHTETFSESVFDLPVFHGERPVRNALPMELVTKDIKHRQAVFSCGVAVNSLLRPIDETGAPIFDNVICCGSILRGYDSLRDDCGAGVAAITGYCAGEECAK